MKLSDTLLGLLVGAASLFFISFISIKAIAWLPRQNTLISILFSMFFLYLTTRFLIKNIATAKAVRKLAKTTGYTWAGIIKSVIAGIFIISALLYLSNDAYVHIGSFSITGIIVVACFLLLLLQLGINIVIQAVSPV